MKRLLLLLFLESLSLSAMQEAHVLHAVKKEKELAASRNPLDDLPGELKEQIMHYVIGNNLNEAVGGIKRLYITFPKLRKDVDANKAILIYLMQKFFLNKGKLQEVVNNLNKFEAFKSPEMLQWIDQQKKRLDDEEELRDASLKGDIKKVEELLKKSININSQDKTDHNTALINAALDNKSDIAMLLVKSGADVNIRNGVNATALFFASFHKNLTLVRELLAKKADPNIKAIGGLWNGQTPLIVASAVHQPEMFFTAKTIIEELLKAGAHPNETDKKGKTAEDYIKSNQKLSDEQNNELLDLIKKYRGKK